MKEGLTKQSFLGFYWQALGSAFQSIIQIGVLILLARLITPDQFGVAQSALIIVGFASLLSQMGVGPAIVQRSVLTNKHIRAGATLSLIFGVTLGLIVYFCSEIVSQFFNMPPLAPVLELVSVIFMLESITVISKSLLQREMKFKSLVLADFISYSIGYALVACIMAYYDYGIWALIWGAISQAIVLNIVIMFIKPHSMIPFFGKKEIKELLYFGGGFTIARFANYLASQGDNIIIGRYLGAEMLGVYSRAYSLMVKPASLIGTAIDKALFPAMAKRQKEPEKLAKAFLSGSYIITLISFPFGLILVISAPEIIISLLGEQWIGAILPFQILSSALVFRMGYKMGDCLARATGEVYKRARRQIIYAVLVIFGCYIGQYWGIPGVAIGTVFAIFINYLLMIHLSLKILNKSWSWFITNVYTSIFFLIGSVFVFYVIIFFMRIQFTSDLLVLCLSFAFFGVFIFAWIYFFPNSIDKHALIPKEINFLKKTNFKNEIKKY